MGCSNNIDIVSIRGGNDIKVTWSIYTGIIAPLPYNLESKDITVYFKSKYVIEKAQDISILGNTVTCYFYGKDQKYFGKYSLELIENEGKKGMQTIDECNAFKIVRCACEASDNGKDDLNYITNLEFRTSVQTDVILDFKIDDDMNLNLTYTSDEDLNNKFVIDEDGQLTLKQSYDKDN